MEMETKITGILACYFALELFCKFKVNSQIIFNTDVIPYLYMNKLFTLMTKVVMDLPMGE
jgi:hypothetical protein